MSEELRHALPKGYEIEGYRIEKVLGAGGFGVTYLAHEISINRKVAIKILSEKHRDSPELRQRFVREGRAVAAISHPNVVQVFATGQFDERPYIAMELLEGVDLGSMVEKRGPLDSLTAAHAILDGAAAWASRATCAAPRRHSGVITSGTSSMVKGRIAGAMKRRFPS